MRLANSADAAALAEVYLAAARNGWKDMYPREALRDDLPSPEGFLIREIEWPAHAVLVAEQGGGMFSRLKSALSGRA